MSVFLSVAVGCVLYFCDQGVNSATVDLVGDTLRLFVWSHCSSVYMFY